MVPFPILQADTDAAVGEEPSEASTSTLRAHTYTLFLGVPSLQVSECRLSDKTLTVEIPSSQTEAVLSTRAALGIQD